MLKLVKFLSKNYAFVGLILISPLLLIFISSKFDLKMVPQNPFPTYTISFHVPSRTAEEIESRVTRKAEKILNSLTGLVSLSSVTKPQFSHIKLRFDEKIDATTSYLYIQEKIDQIKLQVPGDVESIKVKREIVDRPENLKILFSKPVSLGSIYKSISDFKSHLQKTSPETNNYSEIQVRPDVRLLFKEQVALSTLFATLQLNGLTASLGSNEGVMYEKARGFESIEELKANVVGMKEHRPIRLIDVADVKFVTNPGVKEFSIWFDSTKVNSKDLVDSLKTIDNKLRVEKPYLQAIVHQSVEPIGGIVLVILLQLIVLRLVFGRNTPWSNLLFYNSFLSIHFLFWKGVVYSELTVLDLHSLLLCIVIGGGFWVLLFSRMRSYFLPESKIKKIPKSVEQIILFSIVEIVPTLVVLVLCFWIMNFGVSATAMNIPSRNVLETFFVFGAPLLLLLLVVMPVLVHPKKLKDCLELPKHIPNWKLSAATTQLTVFSVLIFGLGSAYLFHIQGMGVNSRFVDQKQVGNYLLDQLRSYTGSWHHIWEYDKTTKTDISNVNIVAKEETGLRAEWQFHPLGLSYLPKLDLLGFNESLKAIGSIVSYLEVNGTRIPIRLLAFNEESMEFGKLLLAGKNKNNKAKSIHLLTNQKVLEESKQILHDKMLKVRKIASKNPNLKNKLDNFSPTQWSEYLYQQLKLFHDKQLMSLAFVFLVLAIFLNSFIRSFLLLLFSMATSSLLFLLNVGVGRTWNVDSLWMIHLLPLLCLSLILIPSKLCDIERSRGHDRDDIVEDVRLQFSPSVFYVFLYWAACLFVMGSSEWLPSLASLGLWYEANFVALIMLLAGYISHRYLFPLYYLESEEALDEFAYKIYRIVYLKGWFGKK